MIFSHVLVHVIAELNILGKYNLLCVYLVVQNLSQRQRNIFEKKWHHLFMLFVSA